MSEPPSSIRRGIAPYTVGRRLLISAGLGVVIGSLVGFGVPGLGWAIHLLSGWDAAGVTLLALAWWRIWHENSAQTRRHAAADDPGRRVGWLLILLASTISLFAAGFVMRRAHSIAPSDGAFCLLLGLCLTAVVTAWVLTHTAYSLRYAHLYYRDDDDGEGGLEFPGKIDPDGFDFAYFSFTLGMCFQVSDVCITSRNIRRAVLAHALLSFLFNTVILGLALNLMLGFLS
ncbi:MAG TPA: DUF1345 domain-containing protein [Polyangiaceae bacterium]|nr:DUF1345 domain-containing protein [Polyangiaceae bacterium]